ncbi:a disintegrin and metalloproteinase with thrombospondin motifs 9 [Caerostris extrusa]|uniref:A disintegrin and metalloproteinase with thrombospondin motifs 9 n=1 Tax=Caerostris extrusa TaxID=172846 RepID=A0AAV4RSS5_CAEEX|nr:a disintegrin and metalloproteinase with thrombospondin motifs 9 [Caerostris extrusa]
MAKISVYLEFLSCLQNGSLNTLAFLQKKKCKLYCKINESSSYFVLREKVIDGTPCSLGSFDICVNGKCEIAGCDHILNSKVSLDRCGVCGGSNNTCYHNVVMIPPGASNLRVTQRSPDGSVDDNYIALKDPAEKYILNGDFMISMFPKTLAYHGITIDYSGSHSVVEHINSSDPLTKDLFVQVLVVGKLQPPNISFSYTVPLTGTQMYSWKLATQYSECTSQNVRLSDLYPVNEDHCSDSPKPSLQKTRKCNEHCTLKWQDVSKLDCSTQCRRGIRQRIIKCMKEEISTKIAHAIPEEHCAHLGPKPSSQEKCSSSCLNSSWIYSDWSECSVSCGVGTQQRTSDCRNAANIKLPDDHCDASIKINSKVCDQGSCPRWMVGNWTECSVTCGSGVKQRPFWCQHEDKYVDLRYCENDNVPVAKETCNLRDCFSWKLSQWEPCPVKCGNGTTHRTISCSSFDLKVDESFCSHLTRPSTIKSCSSGLTCSSNFIFKKNPSHNRYKEWKPPNLRTLSDTNSIPEFNRAVWKEGSWSKCSSICGEEKCVGRQCTRWETGQWSECSCDTKTRKRKVTCIIGKNKFGQNECNMENKPHSLEDCECIYKIDFHHHAENNSEWKVGPWAECSVSCGNGVKRRQVVCYNVFDGVESQDCNLHRKPSETYECNNGPCPDWSTEKWSECNVSCGNGTQIRSVHCFNDDGEIVLDDFCNILKKPTEKQACFKQPCLETNEEFKWILGPWSQCSASCNEGSQHRDVVCLNTQGHEESEEKCPFPKPKLTQSCLLSICPSWKWSEWSQCPKSCGFHQQYRLPHCIRGERIINDKDCFEPKPPTDRRQCKIPPQCSYKWRKGLWSPCYASCGSTFKTREVFCVDNENNRVPEELCSSLKKPKKKRKCNLKPCPYTWVTSQWSECSKTCDEGTRKRHVACHAVNEYGWVEPKEIEKHFCIGTREPKIVESCNYGNCSNGFIWKPDNWQSCKGSCHNAKQKRKLQCFDFEGMRVPNRKCNPSLKPKKKRRCFTSPECPPKSCLEIHNSQGKTADGNYQIVIKGKLVIVYCHAMNTAYPQEYINLRDRNYAVIHSTNLGSQYDSSERCLVTNVDRECDCDRKDFGYTVFSKIALNVSSLKLIANEYTFSQTYHGKPVPYGTAGDCFRRPDCPQGMFFISLQGTGFRIAHETNWISKAGLGQIYIRRTMNDEVIKGKCGGYCDLCIPDPKVGFAVDIS